MSTTSRWWRGAQIGACIWLAIIAVRALSSAIVIAAHNAELLPLLAWPSRFAPLMALVWFLALGLVVAGSRWARLAVAAGICAQMVIGLTEAHGYGEPYRLSFSLRFFLPMCLPLLPLVVRGFTLPRALFASVLHRRFREALAEVGGVAGGVVAVAVLTINRAFYDLLMDVYWGFGVRALGCLIRPLALFGLAWALFAVVARRARRLNEA